MTAFFFLNDLRFKAILPVYLKKYYFLSLKYSLTLICWITAHLFIHANAQNKVDSLKTVVQQENVKNRGDIYLNLFIEYRVSNTDSAIYYATLSSESALQAGDSLMYVRAEYALGWGYQRIGEWQNAITHYSIASISARNNDFIDREKTALNGLATSYYYNGQYDQSLKYHFESLSLREKDGDKAEISVSMNNIGLVYLQIKDYEQAIQYFQSALNLNEEAGRNDSEVTLINLGHCYFATGSFESALEKYERALSLCNDLCEPSMLIDAYHGAGNAYSRQMKYESAEDYFLRAKKIADDNALKPQFVISMNNLAKLQVLKGQYAEALATLEEGQETALELNYRVFINEN